MLLVLQIAGGILLAALVIASIHFLKARELLLPTIKGVAIFIGIIALIIGIIAAFKWHIAAGGILLAALAIALICFLVVKEEKDLAMLIGMGVFLIALIAGIIIAVDKFGPQILVTPAIFGAVMIIGALRSKK